MVRLLTVEEIQAELLEVTPLNPGPLIPPYEEGQEDKQKLKLAYQALRRSIKRKDRLSALINAYFLGKVLNNVEGPRQEYILKKELTSHYITMAENAYILFEFDPTQIFRTVDLDIRDIRRTKKKRHCYYSEYNNEHSRGYSKFRGGELLECGTVGFYCAAGIDRIYLVYFVYFVYFV